MRLYHLILSDLHLPLHDEAAVRGLLSEVKGARIEHLHLLGDLYDFAAFSRFIRTPSEVAQASQALADGKAYLQALISKVNAKKVFFYIGNHEERLLKYILRNAPALFGTVTYKLITPEGAELVEHRWGRAFASHFGTIRFMHGGLVRKTPGATPLEHIRAFQRENIVVGHSHRLSVVYDRHYFGVESGHLSLPEAHDYCTVPPCWTRGFSFIDASGPRVIKLE